MIPVCALNKKTREYVYPKNANKKDEYLCPECDRDVILHQGIIRVHHFVHKPSKTDSCNYFNHPTESQIHKNAKILLKILLDKKEKISFIRKCCCCKKDDEFEIPEISETSNIQLEYRFEYDGLKIADVAYIDNNEIICIFEICYTHKTQSEKRPEPWFEIDALSFIQNANNLNNSSLQINCLRREKCDDCIEFEKEQIEKKKRATDILYDWFKSGNEIPPFVDGDCGFAGIEKNAKCEDVDDTFDVIIQYLAGSISRPLYGSAYNYYNEDKYQRFCIRLICGSNFYFSKEREFVQAGIGVYFVDIDWVLSQQTIPTRIQYIASLDFYNKSSFENFNKCLKCHHETPLYVKRVNGGISDYKVIAFGCLECGYNKNSEYFDCERCRSKSTKFCVAESNTYDNICINCDVELYSSCKIYLSVSFKEKEEAKKLGALWDFKEKRWFMYDHHLNIGLALKKYKQKW